MSRRQPKPWTPQEVAAAKQWEADRVAEGRCPWSGGVLAPVPGSKAALDDPGGQRRCSICDCPGYPITQEEGSAP